MPQDHRRRRACRVLPLAPATLLGTVLLATVLLTAAGSPALGVRATPRHGATITLDSGALRVRPTSAVATITRRQAVFDAVHADAGDGRPYRVAFGAVTVTAARSADRGSPGRLPAFGSTPAWVVFVGVPITPCPAPPPGAPPVVPKGASRALVLLVNARTGAVAAYDGAGSLLCAPNPKPQLAQTAELYSAAWFQPRRGSLSARLPGCSVVEGETSSGSARTGSLVEILALHAFGPCASRPRTVSTGFGTAGLPPPIRHAPVGPISARNGHVGR